MKDKSGFTIGVIRNDMVNITDLLNISKNSISLNGKGFK